MTPITDDEIAALVEAAEAATPGPWQNGIEDLEGVVAPNNPGLGNVICIPPLECMYSSLERWPDNAAYIALANPTTIRALASRVQSDAAVIAGLREALGALIAAAECPSYQIGYTNSIEEALERARAALSPPPVLGGAE